MTWQTCPRCGSPCLIFVQPRCVYVGCVWFDARTCEDWTRSPFEADQPRDEDAPRSADPWAADDAA